MDGSKEVDGEAVVARGDALELLEFVDGALDAVPFLVQAGIEGSGLLHLRTLRDDGMSAAFLTASRIAWLS